MRVVFPESCGPITSTFKGSKVVMKKIASSKIQDKDTVRIIEHNKYVWSLLLWQVIRAQMDYWRISFYVVCARENARKSERGSLKEKSSLSRKLNKSWLLPVMYWSAFRIQVLSFDRPSGRTLRLSRRSMSSETYPGTTGVRLIDDELYLCLGCLSRIFISLQ